MKKLITGILIGLLVGGIGGYFAYGAINEPRSDFMQQGIPQGIQIDERAKQETISFFEGTTDTASIDFYCLQNRINCVYYCTEINSELEVCNGLGNEEPTIKRQK